MLIVAITIPKYPNIGFRLNAGMISLTTPKKGNATM